ncbi:hypothetical protein NX059_012019 [Plenodomus lindquistii]|nr:hypothetical protein NX059_012019 [Plenodomus lindquistii]
MSSADPPRTFLECFEDALPVYKTDAKVEQSQRNAAPIPSKSTKQREMKAPRYLITLQPEHWTNQARKILATTDVKTKLSKRQVYVWEEDNFVTEQAVVDLFGKFAITPILAAINIVHNDQISKGAEHFEGETRTDLRFNLKGGSKKTVLVLEYKCRFYIKPEQLDETVFPLGQTEKQQQDQLEKLQKRHLVKEGSHSMIQLKQACASAQARDCGYAAVCDYETLVLLRLHKNDDWCPGFDSPDYAESAYYRRADITVISNNKKDLRKALLGFLHEAVDASLKS